MAGYSLTVVRPQRIGRLSAPSPDGVRAAAQNESALTRMMAGEGSSFLSGHLFNAQQGTIAAERDYDRATQDYDYSLGVMRDEDRRRAVEDRDFNARRAIVASGISNPAGLAAIRAPETEGLMDDATRNQYGELLRATTEARGRQYLRTGGGGGGGGGSGGVLTPRDEAKLDATMLRSRISAINAENRRAVAEEGNIMRNIFTPREREAALAAARERAAQNIRNIEAAYAQRGSRAPGGSAPAQAGPTAAQTPPAAAAGGAARPATADRSTMIESARRHLSNPQTTPQQREAIRQRLQQNGINPDTLQ